MKVSETVDPQYVAQVVTFLENVGLTDPVPEFCNANGFFSDFVRQFLKLDDVQRGRIVCSLSVKPPITNFFITLHGGAVAAIAETLSTACARTVVGEDKDIFLGELSISYLSGAPINAEVTADTMVVKGGRNVTVVAVKFKLKKTSKLIYTARGTFFNTPVAKL